MSGQDHCGPAPGRARLLTSKLEILDSFGIAWKSQKAIGSIRLGPIWLDLAFRVYGVWVVFGD